MTDVQRIIIRQLDAAGLILSKFITMTDGDNAVRVVRNWRCVRIEYMPSPDTYTVTIYTTNRRTLETKEETTELVYAEGLARFFREQDVFDANTRGLRRMARGFFDSRR